MLTKKCKTKKKLRNKKVKNRKSKILPTIHSFDYLPVVNTRQMDATDCTALVTKPPAMLFVCWGFCKWVGNIISGGWWGCETASHSLGNTFSSVIGQWSIRLMVSFDWEGNEREKSFSLVTYLLPNPNPHPSVDLASFENQDCWWIHRWCRRPRCVRDHCTLCPAIVQCSPMCALPIMCSV